MLDKLKTSQLAKYFLVTALASSGALAIAALNTPLVRAQMETAAWQYGKATAIAQANIIYVNPQSGSDSGSGSSESSAYRTIGYALQQASSGTVIQLAPGQYSAESFPIQLKSGVTLRGNENQQGQGVVISGGGTYTSPTFASQNVTIVAGQNSQISGVTVTNTNIRGTGIWVESTNPIIRNNTFTNNHREGVFVTGSGDAKVENNQFVRNLGNGISVARQASGEIRGNSFEQTGDAIVIGGTATTLVANNQIRNNRDGVIITEQSRPTLQGNTIESNRDYGIVAIGEAKPNLISNTLRGNGNDQLAATASSSPAENPVENPPVSPSPQPSPQPVASTNNGQISFLCVNQGSGFATIVQRGSATIPLPMILWNRTDLGGEMTPKERCQIVTERINKKVGQSGGNLDNLLFTVGPVNDKQVVCLIDTTEGGCSNTNIIFTLSPENAKNPGKVLKALVTFTVNGSGTAVQETEEVPTAPLKPLSDNLQPAPGLWFVGS